MFRLFVKNHWHKTFSKKISFIDYDRSPSVDLIKKTHKKTINYRDQATSCSRLLPSYLLQLKCHPWPFYVHICSCVWHTHNFLPILHTNGKRLINRTQRKVSADQRGSYSGPMTMWNALCGATDSITSAHGNMTSWGTLLSATQEVRVKGTLDIHHRHFGIFGHISFP